MGEGEGKQMSLYGKYYLSPEEMAGLWKNVLRVSRNFEIHDSSRFLTTFIIKPLKIGFIPPLPIPQIKYNNAVLLEFFKTENGENSP